MLSRTRSIAHLTVLCLGVVGATTGCDNKNEEPRPTPEASPEVGASPAPAPASPHGAHPSAGSQGEVSPSAGAADVAIKWTVPEGWKTMPARPMRKATYQIEGKAGPAEVAVFYFGPGQGGGVEANIARWVGQFQGLPPGSEKRSEREVNGLKFSSVSVDKGTFSSGMPGMPKMGGGAKENWAMHATIVQSKSGQYFFKLTGPSETVAKHRDAFVQMLDGITEG